MAPTTVFSVAMAEILLDRFVVEEWVVGGLVLYGAATSFLPLLTHVVRSTEYEDLVASPEMCLVSRLGDEGVVAGRPRVETVPPPATGADDGPPAR